MPSNNNNIFYTKTFKRKSWANYQYELDQAKSPEEKRAARKEYENIIAAGEKEIAENNKRTKEDLRKWNLEEKKTKEEEHKKAEEKKKAKEVREHEKEEALKKGNVNTLKKLNIESKTKLLKKLGRQTKKCKWEHEPGGCWAHTQGKCPFKHTCNNAKGGTRKQRR